MHRHRSPRRRRRRAALTAAAEEATPPGRAIAASSGALAVGMVPLFLVGALSGRIGDDLGFGSAGTGVAVAVFFVVGGLTAVPVGWLADRLGPPASMRVGVAISGGAGLAVAGLVESLVHLSVALGIAGVAIGFVDTAASAWFADTVPPQQQGSAFGVKEASVPTASLLAGLSVPLLAAGLGWRAAFLVGALLVPLVWLTVPRRPAAPPPRAAVSPADIHWGPLVTFAAGVALGTGAATAAATFLVPAFEHAGWSAGHAGLLLAAASVASILTRLVLGRLSDHRPSATWHLVGAAMAAGAIGALVLALGVGAVASAVAAVVVLGLGWGWTGMAFHVVLEATLHAPSTGAGLVLSGLSLGGAAGPAVFGTVSSEGSYGSAWVVAAAALATAAALTAVARRWQRRT